MSSTVKIKALSLAAIVFGVLGVFTASVSMVVGFLPVDVVGNAAGATQAVSCGSPWLPEFALGGAADTAQRCFVMGAPRATLATMIMFVAALELVGGLGLAVATLVAKATREDAAAVAAPVAAE